MRRRPSQNLNIDFWPGFTDAILSVILVLVFIVCIFVVTQTSLFSALSEKDTALADLSRQLAALEAILQLTGKENIQLKLSMQESDENMDAAQNSLDEARESQSMAELDLENAKNDLALSSGTLSVARDDLTKKESELEKSRKSLDAAERERIKRQAALAASAQRIRDLAQKIADYLEQLKKLNLQLADAEKNVEAKDVSLVGLNASVTSLNDQVALLNAKLGEKKKEVDTTKLELWKLLAEIKERDEKLKEQKGEIELLRQFEKYKSEFLARLADVFSGQKNIRVAGDRFVFQSEMLFPSGAANLTLAGIQNLDKFVETYKDFESKIPQDVGFNIQIQGHTDTDPIVRANFASNWELSTARATSVVRRLVQSGVPPSLLSAAGFSQYYPAAKGAAEETKHQNRRIEILLTRR